MPYGVPHGIRYERERHKEKETISKAAQLTLELRKEIEKGLRNRKPLKEIAPDIGEHCSTVSREIRNHYVTEQTGAFGQKFNKCVNRFACQHTHLWDADACRSRKCRNCHLRLCRKSCPDFERQVCPERHKPPYACNGCTDRPGCALEKHICRAVLAQREADAVRSESRSGTHLTLKQIPHMRHVVVPCLKKGQSVHPIWASNKDSLMVGERTLCQMIENGPLSDCTLDLRQKVSRKPPKIRYKPQNHSYKADPACRQNRHYEEYEQYMRDHPGLPHVQMDTVEGGKGAPVILTDNGAEFSDPAALRQILSQDSSEPEFFTVTPTAPLRKAQQCRITASCAMCCRSKSHLSRV